MALNEMFAVLALNPDLKFQNFTRRRDLLLAAVENFHPIAPPYSMRQRVQVTLQAFRTLADNMNDAPGIKSIVWITGGFPQVHSFNAGIQRALNKISEANVAIYPIDARGLMLGTGLLNDRMMDQFADSTGGEAYYNRNDVAALIEEAAGASKSAYIVGFYLDDSDRDHNFHQLKVRVNWPGATLHYRRGYSIPR
jgi:VWFA-related protein